MIKKKKPAKKPAEHELSALDAAVSELSKQTEALLGKADGSKPAKPQLPKKHSKPHAKGKSFDIIHHTKRKTAVPAKLKTAVAEPADEEPQVLLPDHAGKSFNEISNAEPAAVPQPEELPHITNVKAPAIIQHHEGKLNVSGADPGPAAEGVLEEPPKEKLATEPVSVQTVSHTAINFKEPAAEGAKRPEKSDEPPVANDKDLQESTEEKAQPAKETESEEPDKAVDQPEEEPAAEPPAEGSGELFANNLVKETKAKGYTPEEGQQKPTVFDTNEYHPELHDWSKLEHRGSLKWLVLVLLLAVASGLAYLLLSGQELPFL